MRKHLAILAVIVLLTVTACGAPYEPPARSQMEFDNVPADGCPAESFEATIIQFTDETGIINHTCQPSMTVKNNGVSDWTVVIIPPEGTRVVVTINGDEFEVLGPSSLYVHNGDELTAHIEE